MAETERRRRRIRHSSTPVPQPEPADRPSAQTAPVHDPDPEPANSGAPVGAAQRSPAPIPARPRPTRADPEQARSSGPNQEEGPSVDDRETERGLRGLIGAGASQVNVRAALRARDAARPTADDLAAAEADLVIIRRGWVPRDPLTR